MSVIKFRNTGALALALSVALSGAIQIAPAKAQSRICGDSVTLQTGETFSNVARRCEVTLGALVAANRQIANIDAIRPGTLIYMPVVSGQPPRPADPAGPTPAQGTYLVRPGDTLVSIAATLRVTMPALIAANPDIDARALRVGQAIRVPAGAPPSRPPVVATQYVVRAGDTLPRIAAVTGVTIATIVALNPDIDGRNLRVGQVIRLTGTGPIVPARPQITLDPASGPAWREIRVTGTNFPGDRRLDLLVGRSANDAEVVDRVRSDRRGRVSALVDLPRWAFRRDTAYIALRAGPGATPVAQTYRIVRRGGDEGNRVSVTGTLTRGGAECQRMRGDDGKTYSLIGELEDFGPGDRVEVRGRTPDQSICQSGVTIEVRRIFAAE